VTADLHKLSAGRVDYYLREIAKDREEYLSGQGESPGEWLGGSAAALGARGVCSPKEFQRVFAWRHPETGEQLGRAPRSDAMPAWDLVLRPVKDVSVLYALGDDRTRHATREAHQAGVAAAVAYLDGQVGTRRGRGGAEHVGGEGLLAVGFTHRTSRAGDPLLHTHLVIVNRTLGPDGQWRTWTPATCSIIGKPPMPSTGPPTSTSCRARSASAGVSRTAGAIAPSSACPRS
jgi:conjugative relaxase-like TrwC/TraI family protein